LKKGTLKNHATRYEVFTTEITVVYEIILERDNMENKEEKIADLPCRFHYPYLADSAEARYFWKNLQTLYRKNFSGEGSKWIFRGEKRYKKCRHGEKLRECIEQSQCRKDGKEDLEDISECTCYHVENSYFKTSLEKAFHDFEPDKIQNGKQYTRRDLELALLREFQRKAYHHLKYYSERDNKIEWLTIMQHYGGPTRLLDWTYSFYAALFFALTKLDCEKEYAEVWALDAEWIGNKGDDFCDNDQKLKKLLERRIKDAIKMDVLHNAILDKVFTDPENIVFNLNAFRLNERLITQQGTFLVQGNINSNVSFDDNLKGMKLSSEEIHRIVIDITLRQKKVILEELHKMNINGAALFPGLQGFAESLASQLAYPQKFGLYKKDA
jgi:hypothetical protein